MKLRLSRILSLTLLPLLFVPPAMAGGRDKNDDSTRVSYYVPHLLPSVEDASSKIRFLQPHLYSNGVVAQQVFVDQNGVNVSFSQQGTNVQSHYFWTWGGGYNAPVYTNYNNQWSFSVAYSSVRYISAFQSPSHPGMGFLEVDTAEKVYYLNADSIENTRMLLDAMVTLTVATGNTDFSIADFDIDPVPQKELKKLKVDFAWQVSTVQSGSPADRGGLRKGDIILAVNDTTAKGIWGNIRQGIKMFPNGYKVRLHLMRDKVPADVELTYTAPWPEAQARALQARTAAMARGGGVAAPGAAAPTPAAPAAPAAASNVKLGIRAHNINSTEAKTVGLASASGIYVESVAPGGIAEQAKLLPGDVILQIDNMPALTIDQMKSVLMMGAPSAIQVWRHGATLTLPVSQNL
jgi:hypothetical protein